MKVLLQDDQKIERVVGQRGQTLIELLIATLIVGLVVTSVAAGLTYAVKNTAEVRYRESATSLGQDVIEFFRRERASVGWNQFVASLPDDQSTYCFQTVPTTLTDIFTSPFPGSCATNEIVTLPSGQMNADFLREVLVNDVAGGKRVEITVTVKWIRSGTQYSQVVLKQNLLGWDQ